MRIIVPMAGMGKRIQLLIFVFALIFTACKTSTNTVRSDRNNNAEKRQDNSELFLEANTQKLLGNYTAATYLFQQCLDADPEDAASMYELARIARINNQGEKSLAWAVKAVKYDPENVWYLKLLTELYQENMQF